MDAHSEVAMLLGIAVDAAVTTMQGSAGSGGSPPAPPPQITTGVAGDGTTTHPFIWGVDQWGDPAALWTKKRL